jgi:thioesterase domain-containing protein/acyl carrier protein
MPWVRLRLEEDSQAVDGPGSTGEITVCTDHLALGYLGNDELTRERFLARPDGRWYRTGDRAVIRADGTLAFAGRVETTVKIRGRLVDPVAVEQTLLSMPGIEAACVVPFRAATGDPRLAAFAAGGPWDAAAVREYLASELNDYMRPAFVEVMTELPLMANGKVDRQGLTRHAEQGTRADDDEGSSALERALVQVFQDVLGIGRVSRHDDFFVLGADSLATVELIEVIRARLDLELDPATVVEEPTPQGLARVLAKGRPRPGRLARASTGPAHRRPVAYFPGGGGGSLDRIHALVRAMSPRESWIVVPRGFNGRERPDRTITAQARTAATDLLGLSGGGPPAALIGHSAGGVVALESARWMAADGAPSPVVILLDSAVFGRDDSALNRRTHHLKAATRSRRTGRGAATWISTAVSLGAAWARRGYLASTAGLVPRTGLAQHDAFVAVRSIALDRYRLLPYSGPVVLVRATDRSQDRVADERPDLGWRDVLTGPFTIIDVPGDHLSMLREFLPASASVIADVLSRLDDQGSAQGQAFPEPGS